MEFVRGEGGLDDIEEDEIGTSSGFRSVRLVHDNTDT